MERHQRAARYGNPTGGDSVPRSESFTLSLAEKAGKKPSRCATAKCSPGRGVKSRKTRRFRAIHASNSDALLEVGAFKLARSPGDSNTSGATTNWGRRPFIKSTIARAAVMLTRSPDSRANEARCGVSKTF